MDKKLLTAVLCIMVAAIVVITGFIFFGKAPKEPTVAPSDDTTQTTDQTEKPDDTTQTTDQTEKPDDTTQTTDQTEKTDDTVKTEETTDTAPEVTKPADTESETDTQTTKPTVTPEQTKPSKAPETDTNPTKPADTPTDTPTVSVTVSGSYKDFSLTKGKSAADAYAYLNEFLNSKYSILTNKQNKVGSNYAPTNLVAANGTGYKLEATAAKALESMIAAAKTDGIYDLVFCSGYRTYATQETKFNNRIQKYIGQGYSRAEAEKKAGEYIAPPGSSEHHTGLAADVCSNAIISKYGYLSDDFDTTKEFRWLRDNCAEYGFILRYRKDAEGITGFLYEPWHFRYIGKEHAKACTELGITYEEYYSMLVKYRDEAKAEAGV